MYQKIRDNLLPTPSKSHYTFNFRDMSKVVQGMLIVELTKESKNFRANVIISSTIV